VVRQKRPLIDLTKILAFLAPWQAEPAGVVVESTTGLGSSTGCSAGLSVHLANTTAIKQYDGLKHSGDETDARHLAHLLRLGIRPTGTILPRKARNVRDLARKRMWCAAVPPTFSQ
jgi:hypothetical protein